MSPAPKPGRELMLHLSDTTLRAYRPGTRPSNPRNTVNQVEDLTFTDVTVNGEEPQIG
jgi:hypothetical protein